MGGYSSRKRHLSLPNNRGMGGADRSIEHDKANDTLTLLTIMLLLMAGAGKHTGTRIQSILKAGFRSVKWPI